MKLSRLFRLLSVLALLTALTTADAYAQGPGRVRGRVRNADTGEPIADVTVVAQQVNTSVRADVRERPPVEIQTGADGRFSMLGFALGPHNVTLTKEGYQPVVLDITIQGTFEPIEVDLYKVLTVLEQLLGAGALEGLDAIQLTANLEAADAAFNSGDYRTAIAGYGTLLEVLPQMTDLYRLIGSAHRALGKHEEALVAYQTLLESDPENKDIQAEIATTRLAMGNVEAAFASNTGLSTGLSASREDFYNLGELAFASGDIDRAQGWYEKASSADPSWVKPRFKLALVALNKGDMELAKQHFREVVELDPASEEGAQAKATLVVLP